MTRARSSETRRRDDPLAEAIARRDWQRVALYALLGAALASNDASEISLDDVLDVLAGREVRDGRAGD